MNKQKKLSFREAMAYSRRGYAIWWKAAPEVFLSAGAQQASESITISA